MTGQPLTPHEALVIVQMSEECAYWCRTMAGFTGLTEKEVRTAYRSLKAKGLAWYGTCWDEDRGCPHGSGYFLSAQGMVARIPLMSPTGAEVITIG